MEADELSIGEEVTEDELLAVMLELETGSQDRPTGAYRVEELHEQTGRSHVWIRRRLRELIDAGAVVRTKVRIETLAGNHSLVPAYQAVKKQEENKL